MNKKLIAGASALCVALLSLTANAFMQGPPMHEQGGSAAFLEKFDSDGDGQVTREEIEAARAAEFGSADTDTDGKLSYAEFSALETQRKAERLASEFALLDQDGSGGISVAEFSDGHPRDQASTAELVFSLADLDADGSLSQTELQSLRESGHSVQHYAHLDQDGDGIISEAEFTSATPPAGQGGRGRR